jgi:ABC-type phosphate/phosphonate transport system substrate-binding protein
MRHCYSRLTLLSILSLTLPLANAEGPATAAKRTDFKYASVAPANSTSQGVAVVRPLVLSAAPRNIPEDSEKIFAPIAGYLSQVLGRPVVYRRPATMSDYQSDVLAGSYDIVFDDPQVTSWRIARQQYKALVKIPGEFAYTAVVRANNARITDLKQLAGRKICALAPPNLGTLIMYEQFDNPMRQPAMIVGSDDNQNYQSLMKGECEAAILPLGQLQRLDSAAPRTRIIFRSATLPQQAFAAGPRLTISERGKIMDALQSPAAAAVLTDFRQTYGVRDNFVAARDDEYAGLAKYLRDIWGYR